MFTDLCLEVLSEEIETSMRNMGVNSLDQLNPSYVNSKILEMELPDDLRFGAQWPELKPKL
jgi:isopentenyl diphosphate isomerase/L-lactate dehydrogenase-like FMN-dependent dehydrogenase